MTPFKIWVLALSLLLAYIKMLDLKETIDRVIDLEPPDDKMIKETELKKTYRRNRQNKDWIKWTKNNQNKYKRRTRRNRVRIDEFKGKRKNGKT